MITMVHSKSGRTMQIRENEAVKYRILVAAGWREQTAPKPATGEAATGTDGQQEGTGTDGQQEGQESGQQEGQQEGQESGQQDGQQDGTGTDGSQGQESGQDGQQEGTGGGLDLGDSVDAALQPTAPKKSKK